MLVYEGGGVKRLRTLFIIFFFFFYSHITPHSPSGMAGEAVWSRNSRTGVPHKVAPVNVVQANRHEHRETGAHHPAMIKGMARSHLPKPHFSRPSTIPIGRPKKLAQYPQRTEPKLGLMKWAIRPKDPELTTLLSLSGMNRRQRHNKKPWKTPQKQLKQAPARPV